MIKRNCGILLCALFAICPLLAQTEYFVATTGADAADGLSRETAFATIQHGVDVLQPGDTLTILPGEYFEHISREDLGSADAETTIRAAIAGSVLIRGDVAAPEFSKVEGSRFTWQAQFDQPVQAVNELDTLTILMPVGNPSVLDFQPSSFFHDAETGILQISTSDLQPPQTHDYRIAVTDAHGIHLERPVRVIIDGLAVTGFNRVSGGSHYPGYTARWGIILAAGKDCVIRNCTAYFNGGGIALNSGENGGGNVIEDSVAYANYCRASNGGNILAYSPNGDIVRNCYSFRTRLNGIRLYGGGRDGNHHIGNLAWGSGWSDINTKGTAGRVENTIAVSAGNVLDTRNSLIGGVNSKHFAMDTPLDTIRLMEEANLDPNAEFADPANLDYRLQKTSRFRNAAPDGSDRGPFPYCGTIFYLSADGDDSADGQSVASAWRTLSHASRSLKAGDTLYLSAGSYSGLQLKPDAPATGKGVITLRGRGRDDVLIEGPVVLAGGSGFALERLHFSDTVTVKDCSQLDVRNVFFAANDGGLELDSVAAVKIRHATFAASDGPAMRVDGVDSLLISGTIFNNRSGPAIAFAQPLWQTTDALYSNYNSYSPGQSIWQIRDDQLSIDDVRRFGSELQSQLLQPDIAIESGFIRLRNPRLFASGGPLGLGIGYYREVRFLEQGPTVAEGPLVHSTSPTTANIEWWVAQPTVFALSWGETPDLGQTIFFEGNGFNTQSLTKLKPGTTYYYRLRAAMKQQGQAVASEDVHVLHGDDDGQVVFFADFSDSAAEVLSFTTPATAAEPRILYVAIDGDDGNDGLTRDGALRTINQAAQEVHPGDTVMIGGGEYPETVRLRVTGTQQAPIRFAALAGERVTIDGANRSLSGSLIVDGKEFLEFDRLFFTESAGRAAIEINRGGGHRFTRCFLDGRGRGNPPWAVRASGARDVLFRNCVFNNYFSGIHVTHSANFTVEHCVFTRNWIFAANVYNGEGELFIFRNNIVTDNQPDKRTVPFFEICFGSSVIKGDNCYYVRPSEAPRPMLFIIDQPGDRPHTRNRMERLNLSQFQAEYGAEGSIFANPGFPVWADVDTSQTTRAGEPVFPADTVPRGMIDFKDFFATNPEVVERGIGLQPEAF